jgi:membrane associated rhomboid family serine protease
MLSELFIFCLRHLLSCAACCLQLSHVSGLHLLFNCSALWNMGYAEAQRGSVLYLSYTALFLVLSSVVRCLISAAAPFTGSRDNTTY